MQWFVERPSGIRTVGSGPDGWQQCGIDHRDVTEPGRVAKLGFMADDGRQTILCLEPAETLHLAVRRSLGLGHDQVPPPTLLLGIKREDGSGTYAMVQPDGNITLSSRLGG